MLKILKGIVMVTIRRCLRRESILFCFSLNFTVSKVGNNIGKDETFAIIKMKKITTTHICVLKNGEWRGKTTATNRSTAVKLNKALDGNKSGDEPQ